MRLVLKGLTAVTSKWLALTAAFRHGGGACHQKTCGGRPKWLAPMAAFFVTATRFVPKGLTAVASKWLAITAAFFVNGGGASTKVLVFFTGGRLPRRPSLDPESDGFRRLGLPRPNGFGPDNRVRRVRHD